MNATALSGVWAPVLTPFHPDLSIDLPRLVDHCRSLLADGCHGLVIFGTTSEANSLSLDEREETLIALVEAGIPSACLLPGTGNCAIPDTVRLTKRAVALGCAGVLMLPPFYFKAVGDEGLFRFYAQTIERAGAPNLRVLLYHIPSVTQIGLGPALIERLRRAYGGIVVGIKDSSGDWNNTHALLDAFPDLTIFTGSEGNLLATLRGGGGGVISASANVNAKAIRRLYDGWRDAQAEEKQARLNQFRQAIKPFPLMAALKLILCVRLGEPEWNRLRPPLIEMTVDDGRALFGKLASIGFPIKGLPFAGRMLD